LVILVPLAVKPNCFPATSQNRLPRRQRLPGRLGSAGPYRLPSFSKDFFTTKDTKITKVFVRGEGRRAFVLAFY